MSVQVRRRREAAGFLATYVGAQAELLVDTTNNRVQVHDGATPGGFPAALVADLPGRNALINGAFAINQRGFASGSALAAGAYGHDRWKAGAGGCTYTAVPGAPDTAVAIGAGSLVQAVDKTNVTAGAMWLTWTGTAAARVWQGAAPGAFAPGSATVVAGATVNALAVSGLAPGVAATVEFQGGTLGCVQLEPALPGAGPTRFERRHGELALCQTYFRRHAGHAAEVFPVSAAPGGGTVAVALPCLGMRAAPALACNLTDAAYAANPGAGQWALSQPFGTWCAKAGTAAILGRADTAFAMLAITGASFSPSPLALALGEGLFIDLQAEL